MQGSSKLYGSVDRFTVELCEPVQVQTIEIGNLELFSSLPQSIEVNVSDRYVSLAVFL